MPVPAVPVELSVLVPVVVIDTESAACFSAVVAAAAARDPVLEESPGWVVVLPCLLVVLTVAEVEPADPVEPPEPPVEPVEPVL
jgi:hypothetical protein